MDIKINKNIFFIAGLPRSRTSWLANFFTYNDSFCFHEAARFCSNIQDIKNLLFKKKYTCVGNSDPVNIFLWDELTEAFPNAKFVIIERDLHESIDSYLGFFANQSYLDAIKMLEKMHNRLLKIKFNYEPLAINHEDLNSMDTCKKLWNYILPDIEFDEQRWYLLDELYINKYIEKYNYHILDDCLYKKYLNK